MKLLRNKWIKILLSIIAIILIIKLITKIYPILIIVCVLLSSYYLYKIIKRHYQHKNFQNYLPDNLQNLVNQQMDYIDSLTGDQFELYMMHLLKSLGYQQLHHTKFSGDYGLDAVGLSPNGQYSVGFQFKRYKNNVCYQDIAETVSGSLFYNTQYNYIITTNKYTKQALHGAKIIQQHFAPNTLVLDDRADLMYMVEMSLIRQSQQDQKVPA